MGYIFLLSGPSGAGKTTLLTSVLQDSAFKDIQHIVSYTTRQPREYEEHGRDYYFISKEEFLEKIRAHFFYEWSKTYTAWYGTSNLGFVRQLEGKQSIMVVDRAGVASYIKKEKNIVPILVTLPKISDLKARLYKRNEHEKTILQRLSVANQELEEERQNPLFEHVIVNDELESAIAQLHAIIKKYKKF